MRTCHCNIENIKTEKEAYLHLLLLADPSEEFVRDYLNNGELYVIRDGAEVVCASIVLSDGKTAEIKNLSTAPSHQKKGYGRSMIDFLIKQYKAEEIILGTGSTGIPEKEFYQLNFYKKCGFIEFHIIKDFFITHYPDPIIEENGEQCVDMVYLKYKKKSGD